MIFGIKEKSIILTYTIYLAIARNVPLQHATDFVIQGHILLFYLLSTLILLFLLCILH